jgi:hypothetical protein
MKKLYIAFTLLTAAVLLSSAGRRAPEEDSCGGAGRKSAGPPSCYAGELPNSTTCAVSGCHQDFALNSGTAQLLLAVGDSGNTYTPGKTYTVKIRVTKAGLIRGGFQSIALRDNDITTTPGIVTITDNNRTQLIDATHPHTGGGCATDQKVWVEHTSAGIDDVVNDTLTWTFDWQAPAASVGTITFYAAGIEANFDLDNTQDYVYSVSKTLSPNVPSASGNVASLDTKVYPNPFSGKLFIEMAGETAFRITDMNGHEVLKGNKPPDQLYVATDNISAGNYLLYLESKEVFAVKKITKLN